MSDTTDAIVIGGGVIGLTAAWRLRQAGLSVRLLERGRCGREASWAAAGLLMPGSPHRHGPMARMQRDSLSLYPDFCAELEAATGVSVEYERCGAIEPLFDEQKMQMARSDVRVTAEQRMPDGNAVVEVLSPEEVQRLEPALTEDLLGARLCRRSAQVRNPRLLQALLQAARQAGVAVVEESPVVDLKIDGARITGVRTDRQAFHAGAVVVCAGAWSSRFPSCPPDVAPVHPVRGQIVLLQMPDNQAAPFSRIVRRRKCYLVPRRDGSMLLGATEEHDSGFNKHTTAAGMATLTRQALAMVPALHAAMVVATWAGLRPGTPDRRPYIGPAPGVGGLFFATGHFRTGLILAPLTARIITDLLTTGRCGYDLSICAPGRKTH